MTHRNGLFVFLLLLLSPWIFYAACSGGGDDDDSDEEQTDDDSSDENDDDAADDDADDDDDEVECCLPDDPCGLAGNEACDCEDQPWDMLDCGLCCEEDDPCQLADNGACECESQLWDYTDCGLCCAEDDPCGLAENEICDCPDEEWDRYECPFFPEEFVTDANLMWTSHDNGFDISHLLASSHVDEMDLGGYTDWRLPTLEELEGLYDGSQGVVLPCQIYEAHFDSRFTFSCGLIWSSETESIGKSGKDPIEGAWYYSFFGSGSDQWIELDHEANMRLLAVREIP